MRSLPYMKMSDDADQLSLKTAHIVKRNFPAEFSQHAMSMVGSYGRL